MLKKLPQDQLEDESIAAVSTICRALNWDFNVQVKDKSGIDAEIEVVNGIVRTGLFLKCQLKAGKSYISSETEEALRIRVESKYLQHWYQSNVQIALLFYHPIDKTVFWKDIRDFLRVHPNLLTGTQETRIIEFHKKLDLLTAETLPILEQVARGEFHYGFISLQEDVPNWLSAIGFQHYLFLESGRLQRSASVNRISLTGSNNSTPLPFSLGRCILWRIFGNHSANWDDSATRARRFRDWFATFRNRLSLRC